jgi:hypothetical protein
MVSSTAAAVCTKAHVVAARDLSRDTLHVRRVELSLLKQFKDKSCTADAPVS